MRKGVKREISIVMLEFWSVVRAFEESVHGTDVESVIQDAFDRYNEIWKGYCRRWGVFEGKNVELDGDAFMNYVYEGRLDVYTI